MSGVLFHSVDKTVRVEGTERGYAASICEKMFTGLMTVCILDIGKYLKFLPEDHWIHKNIEDTLKKDPLLAMRNIKLVFGSMKEIIIVKNQSVYAWYLHLNTALRMGSNSVKLLARIHGSCEVHGYVEGENRNWLAGLIEDGIETNTLRFKTKGLDNGWLDVADMLRDSDQTPVVLSYTITDPFPNNKNWDTAMNQLRKESLIDDKEFKPETWNTFGFSPKVWIADLWESL